MNGEEEERGLVAWLAWLAAVYVWGMFALVPVLVFLGLIAAGAGALWWLVGP